MSSGAEIKGLKELRAKILLAAQKFPQKIGGAMFQEALIEEAESRERTPVDTGDLKGSHVTKRPTYSGNDIEVIIEVGGSAAPYAIYVHEDLFAHHEVGQAKFLESTLKESKPYMLGRIWARADIDSLFK